MTERARLPMLPIILVLILAVWLRIPGIGAGLPYLYWEDEGHHFNRTVEMVKNGQFNPQYFHKPSLHFYLRMPVVALSFIWSVKKGYLRSINEIETRNPFGLAGYNFTASHPGIVKWNRAFSVVLSLLLILVTALLTIELTGSAPAAIVAALFTAISPDLLRHSPFVGVDILMALMCVLAVYVGLKVYDKFTFSGLCLCGFVCGLAVSSKYNAAPVVVLPLILCALTQQWNLKNVAAALVFPALGFLAASPFVLVSLPMFLDHLAYEIWHYAVAGHEGHSAEPGFPQAMFYMRWLTHDGVGLLVAVAGVWGLALAVAQERRRAGFVLVFPVLFAALMVMQRANFTRNVLVIVPFTALFAGAALALGAEKLRTHFAPAPSMMWLALPVLCLQPLIRSLELRQGLRSIPESRRVAEEYINNERSALGDIAVSGKLQFPSSLYRVAGTTRVDTSKLSVLQLALHGLNTLVTGPEFSPSGEDQPLLNLRKTFDGESEVQRIEQNPQIRVYSLATQVAVSQALSKFIGGMAIEPLELQVNAKSGPPCSSVAEGEEYCWLTSLAQNLKLTGLDAKLPNTPQTLTMSVMSPWPGQKLMLQSENWNAEIALDDSKVGAWTDISLKIPADVLRDKRGLFATTSVVHRPSTMGLNPDTRYLALAIRQVTTATSK